MGVVKDRYTRRDATRLVGLAGLGAWLRPARALALVQAGGRPGAAPEIPSWPTELRRLAPDVYAYTQASGPGVDNASLSNAGVIAGPDGLLAIDTLGPPIHAKAFKAAAQAGTGQRFNRVVNTHHHRDHTNGNCFFTPVEIVSSEYTRQATIDDGIPPQPYDTRPQWQDGMSELTLAPPTTTITGGATYRYGETVVEVIPNYPAHTFGDLMVYLPQQRILFAGDIAFYYVTPAGHNAQITRWIDAVDRINRMDVNVIVPGHGPIGTKKELADTRAYLEVIVEETRKRHAMGMSPGRAAADIPLGRFAAWTNPERNAWNTVRLYAEFDGRLKPEQDLAAQNAAVAEYLAIRRSR
jgi:cyclase